MKSQQSNATLSRFFTGISEQVFQTRLGVADPCLTDYLSDLLMRFVRCETQDKIRNKRGKPARYVYEMLREADKRIGEARREVHRHIGDFTLFWAGLYPESLRKRQGQVRIDQFEDYCAHGKHAYLIASGIEGRDVIPANDVLERIGQQFEMCAYGLREVRREWERRDADESLQPSLWN